MISYFTRHIPRCELCQLKSNPELISKMLGLDQLSLLVCPVSGFEIEVRVYETSFEFGKLRIMLGKLRIIML